MIDLWLNDRPPRQWFDDRIQMWSRPLIVALVLISSAYFAPRASLRPLAAIFGAGALLILVRWPPLGLAALIGASLVVPFALDTGTKSSINIVVLLLPVLVWLWGLDMLVRREPRLLRSRPLAPLMAFTGVSILAFLVGTQSWLPFAQTAPLTVQAAGLAIFLLSAAAFLLVAHQVRDLRWLKLLTWLFLTLGALYLTGRLLPELRGMTTNLFQPGSYGSVFWIWLASLSFSQAAFNRAMPLPGRLVLAGLTFATFYVALMRGQDWISGWVPPLVAVGVALLIGAPRLGLPVLLAGGVVAALNAQDVIALVMIGDNPYSLNTRMEAWRTLWQIVDASPVLGLGPANYYWYTPYFPILGWYVYFSSHNNYVDIVAQTGLLGLACFGWFVLELGWLGWRLRTRVLPGFGKAYVCGAMGGLAGMIAAGMLGDWVLPFIYNVGLNGIRSSILGWLFLGGLITLEQVAQRRAPVEQEVKVS